MNLLILDEVKQWDFSLLNYDTVWEPLIQIGLILLFLLIGNILRNCIPFLKKSLIPSALIGGLLLLIFNMIFKAFDITLVSKEMMQVVTYHGLGIGFIAMTLKTNKDKKKENGIKAIENGAMTGGAYMLQAFVGLVITIIFYLLTKASDKVVYYCSGVLLPLGYGQGPGNALAWDIKFSTIIEDGVQLFKGNGSFGLTIASIGFIVASVVGVIYINIFKKKGEIVIKDEKENERKLEEFISENEIEDCASIDKFSIQVGLVAFCYGIAFLIMVIFAKISDFTNGIAWGFNFIWGVIAANLVKLIMNLLEKKKIHKKKYINNYQMDRISGFAFDIMIVAGVAAIQIEDIKDYVLPLIILCVVGMLVTYIYIRIVTKHCFKGYEHEMFVTNFGTVTGTASNGMILLKEIDKNYTSPASSLFVISQLPAMLFVAPLLLLLNFASKSFTNTIIATIIFFVLFILYNLFLFRDLLKKKSHQQ